jgi:uncharacterized membrane protein
MPSARSPIVVGFAIVLTLIFALIQLNFIEYAYERIGVAPQYVLAVLIGSLIGSYVNFPIAVLRGTGDGVPAQGTVVAINLGGAVIPLLLSAYLLARNPVWMSAALATVIVAAAVHRIARPVPNVGIVVPVLIPPVIAAVTALLLAPASAPAVAYVAGTLGTLIGADVTNLQRVRGLGAPVVSIGGAGTFDGIFVTGILAVLLA